MRQKGGKKLPAVRKKKHCLRDQRRGGDRTRKKKEEVFPRRQRSTEEDRPRGCKIYCVTRLKERAKRTGKNDPCPKRNLPKRLLATEGKRGNHTPKEKRRNLQKKRGKKKGKNLTSEDRGFLSAGGRDKKQKGEGKYHLFQKKGEGGEKP